jgi:hypothetical protein
MSGGIRYMFERLSVLGIAWAVGMTQPAQATTLASSKLADIAALSNAVVQGVVKSTVNLIDPQGVPWTIYYLAVDKVLAGQVADNMLGFRCVGGTAKDRALVLTGAPRIAVGDSIVAFLHQDGLCQVSGLEYGVFWKRRGADGIERLVDFRGRALAAMGGDNIVLSSEIIPSEKRDNVPETHTTNADHEDEEVLATRPPAAPVDAILSEMAAFSKAYLTTPDALRPTVDLTGVPSFQQDRAPAPAKAEVQK